MHDYRKKTPNPMKAFEASARMLHCPTCSAVPGERCLVKDNSGVLDRGDGLKARRYPTHLPRLHLAIKKTHDVQVQPALGARQQLLQREQADALMGRLGD